MDTYKIEQEEASISFKKDSADVILRHSVGSVLVFDVTVDEADFISYLQEFSSQRVGIRAKCNLSGIDGVMSVTVDSEFTVKLHVNVRGKISSSTSFKMSNLYGAIESFGFNGDKETPISNDSGEATMTGMNWYVYIKRENPLVILKMIFNSVGFEVAVLTRDLKHVMFGFEGLGNGAGNKMAFIGVHSNSNAELQVIRTQNDLYQLSVGIKGSSIQCSSPMIDGDWLRREMRKAIL